MFFWHLSWSSDPYKYLLGFLKFKILKFLIPIQYPGTTSKHKHLKDFFSDQFLHNHFKIAILIQFPPVQLNAK